MIIQYKKGDLLNCFEDGECDVIAHCCNCQGVMGSGIAAQIKDIYPEAYASYIEHEDHNGGLELGTCSYADIGDSMSDVQTIVNLHAQNLYGYDGSRFVNYEALYETLRQTKDMMLDYGRTTLGVPYKMACDRAGGDWRIVEAMIQTIFENTGINILVVEYEPRQ